VLKLFNESPQVWNHIAVVVAGVNLLEDTVSTVTEVLTLQNENDPKGYTLSKENAKSDLEDTVYLVGVRLRAFAGATGNDVLANTVKHSRGTIDQYSFNRLLIYSRTVANASREYLPQLSAYQINQNTVDALEQKIENTAQLYAKRDVVVDKRMETTVRLQKLFAQGRKQVKNLDNLVEGFIEDDSFVASYFNARRIHDIKGRKAAKEEEGK
jgi:hypothetical protein